MNDIINMPAERELDTKPMSKEQTAMMMGLMMIKDPEKVKLFDTVITSTEQFISLQPEEVGDTLFLPQILQTRIDTMKLPIRFTNRALIGTLCLTDRPGAIVILLIDCLEHFVGGNGETPEEVAKEFLEPDKFHIVTMDDLVSLYPMGFYNFDNPKFIEFIDTRVKNRNNNRISWAWVYE